MLKFKCSPFEGDIERATNENNLTDDWAQIMLICDKAVNYEEGSKTCFKAILKRLHHNVPRVALQTLTLLDACVKNCDRNFHLQIASQEFIQEARKLLPKMHPSVSLKLKELIQKWSFEEFKSDPELCIIPSFYYKLKSEGMEFPEMVKDKKPTPPISTNPDVVSSQQEENDIIKAIEISMKDTGRYPALTENENQSLGLQNSTVEPFKVRALYDFEAAEDNELTINAGEIVLVLDDRNSNWWKGSNHRGDGLFPANFVSKDLTAQPDEPPVSEAAASSQASIEKALENIEVKLDETKIEMAIKWLNEADPTGEIPDPEEMILLERECLKMVPLLEESFQAVDNRLVRLNLVNKQIMDAFELFHSLSMSNSVFTSSPSMQKYQQNTYDPRIGSFVQSQVSSTTSTTTEHQQVPPVPSAFYVPSPSNGHQFIRPNTLIHGRPVSAIQTPALQPLNPHPLNTDVGEMHKVPGLNVDSTANGGVASSSVLMTQSGMPYAQESLMFPQQSLAAFLHYQRQMQGFPSMPEDFMSLPFPMSSAGPYIPFPVYYSNSAVQMPPNHAPVSSSSTMPNTTLMTTPKTVQDVTPSEVGTNSSKYSHDLQQISVNLNDGLSSDSNIPKELFQL